MFRIKTIDKLLVKSFLPPFVMAYFVAMFVLIMQFLWKYIDDIVGKGLGVGIILELLGYLSMTLVPMALPIAVLIASVMVMGNMAERYELASMKSAGIPLSRIMGSLMVLGAIIMMFSYVVSNYIIPVSNLKFHSRLHDIRNQQPALSLEESTFNDDFKDVVIRIGKKGKNNRDLREVMLYDHSRARKDEKHTMIAERGEMYTTKDEKYMILSLKDGTHYQDVVNNTGIDKGKHPFIRTSFKELEKVFDLSQFDLDRTDESLFKGHQRMMNSKQLYQALDSIDIRDELMISNLKRNSKAYFYFRSKTSRDTFDFYSPMDLSIIPDTTVASIIDFIPKYKRPEVFRKATTLSRRVKDYTRSANNSLLNNQKSRINHLLELHHKYAFAFACFMFLFIGAPMGAIVRKGGFGWPILIAIIFFMLFVVFLIVGEKLGKEQVLNAVAAGWLPNLVLFPVGMFLTYKAMRDSKMLSASTYTNLFKSIGRIFNKK